MKQRLTDLGMDPNLDVSGEYDPAPKEKGQILDFDVEKFRKPQGAHVFSGLENITNKGIDWLMNNVKLGNNVDRTHTTLKFKSKRTRSKK